MTIDSAFTLTKQGIAYHQAGDTSGAARLLVQAVQADPAYEMAWLWLASCLSAPGEQRYCLDQALHANPASAPAQKGIAALGAVQWVMPAALNVPIAPTRPATVSTPKSKVGILLTVLIGILAFLAIGAWMGGKSRSGTAAVPAAAPTLDLDSLVVQSGDLPSGFNTFTASLPWQIYPGIPRSATVSYYEIYQGSDKRNEVGHISVIRYGSTADLDKAHQAILAEVAVESTPAAVAGIGDRAVSTGPTPSWDNSDVLFVRCTTVVHITFPQPVSVVEDYAKRLDQRLIKVVC